MIFGGKMGRLLSKKKRSPSYASKGENDAHKKSSFVQLNRTTENRTGGQETAVLVGQLGTTKMAMRGTIALKRTETNIAYGKGVEKTMNRTKRSQGTSRGGERTPVTYPKTRKLLGK